MLNDCIIVFMDCLSLSRRFVIMTRVIVAFVAFFLYLFNVGFDVIVNGGFNDFVCFYYF